MGSKLFTALFVLLVLSPSYGFELSGETGFYNTELKGEYERQVGYDLWNSKKEGFLLKLKVAEEFRLGSDAKFRLSVTTGTTKAPFVTLFSSDDDKLFSGDFRSFNLRELYVEKEHFLLENLFFRAGKQPFNLFPFIDDYLWGGTFTFRFSDTLSFSWHQIAGYEGKYLLFNSEKEDDVDLFGGKFDWRAPLGKFSVGFYRLSDAKGEDVGVNKNTFLFTFKPSLQGTVASFAGALQNGKELLTAELKLKGLEIIGGYAEKGFTSYGFREGIRDLSYIYKPTLSDVTFLKAGTSFSLEGLNLKLHTLYLENVGSELGGELSYPFYRGELFLRGALGTDGSYFTYAGYRWGVDTSPLPNYLGNVEVENYFNLWGEYADFPQKEYSPQIGYEGWERAKHVGYWHSTYKLSLKLEGFSLKVSTGRDSKVDYVVWGNTADNFLYAQTHGKLWHFEEASYSLAPLTFGLQRVEVTGFISENLTGVSFSKGLRTGVFTEEGRKYLLFAFPLKRGELLSFHKVGGERNVHLFGFSENLVPFSFGYLRELFEGGRKAWGAFVRGETEVSGFKGEVFFKVYSKNFTTFGVREFFRDEGFIYRPGEKDVRFLRAKVSKKVHLGFSSIDKFSPEISFLYDRLTRFSGGYVGEEGGVTLSLKPGKRCRLEIVELFGSEDTYYHGLRFSLSW
ncbi:hypothetical protein [Phorcysia thermohydrogeniphila]|uniref:Uncharacterized protein n=1 Tax=Phorcysia thermohydrogeniphila TaxID=936138 RepID=A0A4R1GHQ3_9BACT|nr:hypothetical protein [Phorcysia thermohydrogeniphila]TCK06611.1 hypothetical protein CLV27_0414 [Phorcysia thermohydrogeniphila]